MKLNQQHLINAVNGAVESKASYFAVRILNEQNNQSEIITNTTSNMVEGKLDYYLNAYNEDLELKYNNHIKIAGFTFGDKVDSLFKDLGY